MVLYYLPIPSKNSKKYLIYSGHFRSKALVPLIRSKEKIEICKVRLGLVKYGSRFRLSKVRLGYTRLCLSFVQESPI